MAVLHINSVASDGVARLKSYGGHGGRQPIGHHGISLSLSLSHLSLIIIITSLSPL